MSAVKRIVVEGKGRDERGWVLNPLELAGLTGRPVGALHVASLRPGAVRGNHAHANAVEWVVFCGGPVRLFVGCPGQPRCQELSIPGTDTELIGIPAGIPHAFRNDSATDIHIVVFYDTDPETSRASVLDPNQPTTPT